MSIQSENSMKQILSSLEETPKSAKQLSHETGLSIWTVNRKLKQLKESKKVKISGDILPGGIRITFYSKKTLLASQ